YYYQNYKKPQGLAYENVWSISYRNTLKTTNSDSLTTFYENIRLNLKALPQIKELSFSSDNYPYSTSSNSTGLNYDGKSFNVMNTNVEADFMKVLGMKLLEGRWHTKEDGKVDNRNLVINASLKKAMFGEEQQVVGKLLDANEKNQRFKIIGVVEDVKNDGDFEPAESGVYRNIDTAGFNWIGNILLKVSPDADAAFESRLSKLLSRILVNSNIEIKHLDEMRVFKNKITIVPMIICLIISGFLIINVALGLFGVLWYNISQRRGEIGLRRAIGASGISVSMQLVAESLMLSSLSILVGVFFAIQFPLLHVFDMPASVYLLAILCSITFIYLLVILCSLYPGQQAAAIHPAVALHEE
uniref:ABC transporter permease n=1 Tax=Pedobacter sp. TaxID=1411316 RepID=UPI003D7F45EC